MQYQKIDARSVKSWRISGLIGFVTVLCVCTLVTFLIASSELSPLWRHLAKAAMIVALCISIADIVIFPVIEYRQWGYILEDDRVVIRHGIFFVRETVIPIIRIQNITISQVKSGFLLPAEALPSKDLTDRLPTPSVKG